jgi:hypothetical protein
MDLRTLATDLIQRPRGKGRLRKVVRIVKRAADAALPERAGWKYDHVIGVVGSQVMLAPAHVESRRGCSSNNNRVKPAMPPFGKHTGCRGWQCRSGVTTHDCCVCEGVGIRHY